MLNFKVVGIAHTNHPHVFSKHFDKVHIVKVDRGSIRWVYAVLNIASEYQCKAVLPIDF